MFALAGDRLASADAFKRECAMSPTCPEALAGAIVVCKDKGGVDLGIMGPCTPWPDGRHEQCVTCRIPEKAGGDCPPERRLADARIREMERQINEDQNALRERGFQMGHLEPAPFPKELARKVVRLLVDKAILSTAGGRPQEKSTRPDPGYSREVGDLKTRLGVTPFAKWESTPRITDALSKLLARAARQADPAPLAGALSDALGTDLGPENLRSVAAVTRKALPRAAEAGSAWGDLVLDAVFSAWDTGLDIPVAEAFLGWESADLSDIKARAERLKQQLTALWPARQALSRLPSCR
jgi:hypothetical protein